MGSQTPNFALPYPTGADTPDVVRDMLALATRLDALAGLTPGYGLALPATPFDGQEYVLVDSVTNPTYQWRFRYNAGSTSPYKWECVGGSSASATVDAGTGSITTGGNTFVSSGGPSITLPRAGDYLISVCAELNATGTGPNAMMSYAIPGSAPNYIWGIYSGAVGQYNRFASNPRRHNGLTVGVVEAQYSSWSAGTTVAFSARVLTVQPVRVM